MKLYYAGIGSRKTPPSILSLMSQIAGDLQKLGFILRSGGANGADSAFSNGIKGIDESSAQIFLPWHNFNGNKIGIVQGSFLIQQTAREIAAANHPAWSILKDPVRKLMERNVYQVLGENLKTPSSFVICWTPDGCERDSTRSMITGGTGMAISVADKNNVHVINLKNIGNLHISRQRTVISEYAEFVVSLTDKELKGPNLATSTSSKL